MRRGFTRVSVWNGGIGDGVRFASDHDPRVAQEDVSWWEPAPRWLTFPRPRPATGAGSSTLQLWPGCFQINRPSAGSPVDAGGSWKVSHGPCGLSLDTGAPTCLAPAV